MTPELLEQDILDKGIYFAETAPPSHIPLNAKKGGYQIYQTPIQLVHLVHLLLEAGVSSYCEIGIKFGGTFRYIAEKLFEKNPLVHVCGIDVISIEAIRRTLAEQGISTITYSQRSQKVILDQNYDAIFIDGDHSYTGVSGDFERFKDKANMFIIFHDISNKKCPDVMKFWNQVKEGYTYYEFVQNGPYGIGVLDLR